VQERLAGAQVSFEQSGDMRMANLPVLLFDTVVDNLVRNALDKITEPEAELQVVVALHASDGKCSLQVTDNGLPLDGDRADLLFVRPLPSDRGLGIGLYQASRLAESLDYRLALTSNKRGRVRFELGRAVG
jgi:sensor histidine kinase regulating citrate/malate metabolism